MAASRTSSGLAIHGWRKADPDINERRDEESLPAGTGRHAGRRPTRAGAGPAAMDLVPKVGIEPTRGCPQRCLRPPRLPFRHFGRGRATS